MRTNANFFFSHFFLCSSLRKYGVKKNETETPFANCITFSLFVTSWNSFFRFLNVKRAIQRTVKSVVSGSFECAMINEPNRILLQITLFKIFDIDFSHGFLFANKKNAEKCLSLSPPYKVNSRSFVFFYFLCQFRCFLGFV